MPTRGSLRLEAAGPEYAPSLGLGAGTIYSSRTTSWDGGKIGFRFMSVCFLTLLCSLFDRTGTGWVRHSGRGTPVVRASADRSVDGWYCEEQTRERVPLDWAR